MVMVGNFSQPANADVSMLVMVSGSSTVSNEEQPENVYSGMKGTPLPMVAVCKPVQFWNARSPSFTTLSGMVTAVKPGLFANAS